MISLMSHCRLEIVVRGWIEELTQQCDGFAAQVAATSDVWAPDSAFTLSGIKLAEDLWLSPGVEVLRGVVGSGLLNLSRGSDLYLQSVCGFPSAQSITQGIKLSLAMFLISPSCRGRMACLYHLTACLLVSYLPSIYGKSHLLYRVSHKTEYRLGAGLSTCRPMLYTHTHTYKYIFAYYLSSL